MIWAGCVAGGGTGASPGRRRQCCFWHLLTPSTETREHCPRSHCWAECQGHHVWPRSDMMTAFTWSPRAHRGPWLTASDGLGEAGSSESPTVSDVGRRLDRFQSKSPNSKQ